MKASQVFELYEKLYFHEVEAREKIAGRLQIPLAILLSITSIFAFFLKGTDFSNYSVWNIIFFSLVTIGLLLHLVSASYFIRAFYGHTYEVIPSPVSSERYRQELIETYKEYDDCDELVEGHFKNYLFTYFAECATQNAHVNDNRSELLHKCNTYYVINLIPLFLAFVVFIFANLDKNNVDKQYKVIIEQPVKVDIPTKKNMLCNGVIDMTSLQRPPPPPPPPKRLIKEDVQIPPKPVPPKPQPQRGG